MRRFLLSLAALLLAGTVAEARPLDRLRARLHGHQCPQAPPTAACPSGPVTRVVQYAGQRIEQAGVRVQALPAFGGCASGKCNVR